MVTTTSRATVCNLRSHLSTYLHHALRYWPKLNTVSGIRALYDGLSPAVLRGLFAGALFMGTNDSFKRLFAGGTEESRNPLAPSFILAGAATGLVEAMVYCPFETAKVQLQVGNYQTTR